MYIKYIQKYNGNGDSNLFNRQRKCPKEISLEIFIKDGVGRITLFAAR